MPELYYAPDGAYLEDKFEQGSLAVPGYYKADGSALTFAPINGAPKIADVRYCDASGTDVSNIWLGKGLGVSDGGVPDTIQNLITISVTAGPTTATASLTYYRSGRVSQYESGDGHWAYGTNPGDNYDINYTVVSGDKVSGAGGGWLQLSQDRTISISATASGGKSRSASARVNIQIRRRADGAVLVNRTITLSAGVTTDA